MLSIPTITLWSDSDPPPSFKNGQTRPLHSMPYMYIWPSYVNFHMWVSFLPIFAMGFIGTRLVSRANLEWKKTSPAACEPTNCATACRCIFTWLQLCFDKPLPAGKAIRTIRVKPSRKWPWAGDASLASYSFFCMDCSMEIMIYCIVYIVNHYFMVCEYLVLWFNKCIFFSLQISLF